MSRLALAAQTDGAGRHPMANMKMLAPAWAAHHPAGPSDLNDADGRSGAGPRPGNGPAACATAPPSGRRPRAAVPHQFRELP